MLAPAPEVMAEIVRRDDRTEISFRRRGHWLRVAGIVALFAVWTGGAVVAALLPGAGSGGPAPMPLVWLGGWTLLGLLVLFMLLWRALGTEALIARPDSLTLMRRLLFIRSPIVLPAADITAIEWEADDPNRRAPVHGSRLPQSAISITAHDATLRCASGIDEGEAQTVIASLAQRLGTATRPR